MLKEYRVDVHIRNRGCAPMDFQELKSENYDSYEDYAEAVARFVIENIYDDLEIDEGDE